MAETEETKLKQRAKVKVTNVELEETKLKQSAKVKVTNAKEIKLKRRCEGLMSRQSMPRLRRPN